jgi:2-oxoisovalerate dehydrogenase E2 component (dihydrolipoyl transacylase)
VSIFKLPDLGEGLQEAEIRGWHVAPGDTVAVDQPLVSVETDKAVVDIPSPQAGTIVRIHGADGDIVKVGAPLIEFEGAAPAADDAGTVVGRVERSSEGVVDSVTSVARSATRIQAVPAVRALARRLNVDLGVVTPTGPDDTITAADVKRVARILADVGPLEPLRGVRRTMAKTMAQAHEEVACASITDDADIGAWYRKDDITVRLARAIIAAAKAEPSLNAWYDSHAIGRRVLSEIHLGIAMDTPDGLFVPVLRDAGSHDMAELRSEIERLKREVRERTITPEDLRGHTFILSNYGTFAGRYATPIVLPPTVGILGAGRGRKAPVVVDDEIVVRPILPLSLTFDHRAVTGGEAARFLAAAMRDLQEPTAH